MKDLVASSYPALLSSFPHCTYLFSLTTAVDSFSSISCTQQQELCERKVDDCTSERESEGKKIEGKKGERNTHSVRQSQEIKRNLGDVKRNARPTDILLMRSVIFFHFLTRFESASLTAATYGNLRTRIWSRRRAA